MGKKRETKIYQPGDTAQYVGTYGDFKVEVVHHEIVDASYLNAAGDRVERVKVEYYTVRSLPNMFRPSHGTPFRAEMWEIRDIT